MRGLGLSQTTILRQVTEGYLGSCDFNGLALRERLSPKQTEAVCALVQSGLVQVVTDDDFPNPHIRPWASRRTVDAQVADIERAALPDAPLACLYPTASAMAGDLGLSQYADEPYKRRMAEGAGSLDLAFFSTDVLEPYRSDPKYEYWFGNCEVRFYEVGTRGPDHLGDDDNVFARAGVAYDVSSVATRHIERYLCTFLMDQARFPALHQRRWRTYELPEVPPERWTGG